MFKTLLGGLIGGVAMYLVGFIFWGTPLSALAFHRAESGAGSNLQAAMAQALTPSGTGVYVIPDPATAEGTVLYGKGPVAMVFYNSSGFPVTDAGALIGGLILALVVGVLIALMLRFISGDLGERARVTILFALTAVLWLHVGQAVFNHTPWGYSLYLAFSDFVALVAAGLVAAKIMEGGRPTGFDPVVDETVH
ncbi:MULTISPECIES: hypothetical protein [unclassified Sphingobium]|uniref:hypothetical protein n=1 Tax=unclassified Sphingobium TaxID=2611147 RepID=UPI000770628B|nr:MULTISPECIES: hypothetical protein [Sphingomonadaceae]AMK22696.1 hypothetical protein K426_08755 [Sphingobium sp. TKS]NML90213.1 hypothetical protein [Sphingobium sp. TB-6]